MEKYSRFISIQDNQTYWAEVPAVTHCDHWTRLWIIQEIVLATGVALLRKSISAVEHVHQSSLSNGGH